MAIQFQGTGRRKESVARVRLVPGTGEIVINKRPVEEYFDHEILIQEIKRPLELVGAMGTYDVFVNVHGGGFTGQTGAIRHGISRALVNVDEENRPKLRGAGYLTRDPRMKERKKYGLKKARKSPQFSKR